MFNQLTAAQVVTAIGATARATARSEKGELSDFERDQLMSAYSATRHLAVELEAYPAAFERFSSALGERLADADAPGVDGVRKALREGGRPQIGDALSEALAQWREAESETTRELRADVQRLLRDLADREVDLLADALG